MRTKIRETDVKDKSGEIIISPGLKVRHKDSQFEYTVDGVTQDKDGKVQVVLKLPEEPRFEPQAAPSDVITSRSKKDSSIIYEVDPNTVYYEIEPSQESEGEPELISVSEDEFEQEYEVG